MSSGYYAVAGYFYRLTRGALTIDICVMCDIDVDAPDGGRQQILALKVTMNWEA
ncbi:hypothetical protein AAKU61_004370 [Undibacterium sp. GrIS 1.2]